MHQRLNIITGHRPERMPVLANELETQGITNYRFWDSVYLPSVKASINAAHRQIIEYAKLAEFPDVIVAEDDVKFSAPGAWEYFLSKKPRYFDIYLGGIFIGEPDENGDVKEFTGMTMYCVSERFYSRFLAVDPNEHIDVALAGRGHYVVCDPFVVTQHDGHSTNTGKFEKYGELQQNRIFFVGK